MAVSSGLESSVVVSSGLVVSGFVSSVLVSSGAVSSGVDSPGLASSEPVSSGVGSSGSSTGSSSDGLSPFAPDLSNGRGLGLGGTGAGIFLG